MKTWLLLAALLSAAPCAALDWQPAPGDALQRAAKATAEAFLSERPALQRYFDEAHAYAIFPRLFRAGFLFGGGGGRGVVVQGDRVIGEASQWQLTIGAQLGGQVHAQIIFFRDAAALAAFQAGRAEFIGQTSVAAGPFGGGVVPGYAPAVAIFNRGPAGLMLEASAGRVAYRYRPLD
ncbi:MAG: hypothetical protein D6727_04330 [Gammaproteobacteria bacterium]|nr:MAG: hypothetical protein D6727_04330 [Gammaproteobacteria bacterium]